MKSLIYGPILFIMASVARIAADTTPAGHASKWRQKLEKRANSAQCINTCNTFTTGILGCSNNISTYASCYCSDANVNSFVNCVSCGVTEATAQYEITLAEQSINQFLQACAQLGYPNINITITARPTVSFPCTDGAVPTQAATGATTAVTPTKPITASPTPAPSASNPFAIDPSQLAELSNLLGQLSSLTF